MPKKSSLKKPKSKYPIFISIICLILAGVAIFTPLILTHKTTLDSGYYGESEVTDIDKSEYEKLIKEQKSFVLMIDHEGCTTTAKMREMLKNLSNNEQFKYYRILWPDAKDTNLHDYIKYSPSIAIIDKGKVKACLRADSDEDAKYYNNQADLESWLNSNINF